MLKFASQGTSCISILTELHYYNFLHKHLHFLGINSYQLISPRLLMTFFLNAKLFFFCAYIFYFHY